MRALTSAVLPILPTLDRLRRRRRFPTPNLAVAPWRWSVPARGRPLAAYGTRSKPSRWRQIRSSLSSYTAHDGGNVKPSIRSSSVAETVAPHHQPSGVGSCLREGLHSSVILFTLLFLHVSVQFDLLLPSVILLLLGWCCYFAFLGIRSFRPEVIIKYCTWIDHGLVDCLW
jgi:hypothetical protein